MNKPRRVFMLFTMMLALSGCFWGNKQEDNLPSETETLPQVTIKYASWMAKGEDKPILKAFMEKYPHIKVVDEILDGSNYDTLIKTRLLSNDAPDVFLFMGGQYDPFVHQDWLLDVTNEPEVLKRKGTKLAEFFLYRNGEGDPGKTFGVSVSSGVFDSPIYYNKKYFAKLGVFPPETLEQFYALCGIIKKDGKNPFVIGIKGRWPMGQIMFPFWYTDTLGRHPKLGENFYFGKMKPSDVYNGSLSFLETLMINEYIGKDSLNMTYDQSVQSFVDGSAAMLPMGSWIPEVDVIKNSNPELFELGIFSFPFPWYNGKIHLIVNLDRNLGISKKTKHLEEAQKLFNFFLEKQNLKGYLESQSLFTLDPKIDIEINPVLADFVAKHQNQDKYEIHFNDNEDSSLSIPTAFGQEIAKSWDRIVGGSTAKLELERLNHVYDQTKDDTEGPALTANWNFNTDLDKQEWIRPGGEFTVANGKLILSTSTNYAPFILSPDRLNMNDSNRFIRIRMKILSNELQAMLDFITNEDEKWDVEKRMSFMTVPNSYNEYLLDMGTIPGWTGSIIKQIKLTPFNKIGTANIDYISISAQ